MPMFMDIHPGLGDATIDDVASAHQRDLLVQDKHGVHFLSYWFNDPAGSAFCLVEAPDQDAVKACHMEAHGLMPHKIIEIAAPTLANFMGDWSTNDQDLVLLGGPGSGPDTGLRAIMFTDIAGSTDLSTRLGDDAAVAVVELHDSIVRMSLQEHGGREIKHTGDGILASFKSVTAAVQSALLIQEGSRGSDHLAIKIGISAGEPVGSSNDIYGAAVNLAARVCAHAAGGQTLVSSTVRDLAVGKQIDFLDSGVVALRGFPQPIQLYEVGRS